MDHGRLLGLSGDLARGVQQPIVEIQRRPHTDYCDIVVCISQRQQCISRGVALEALTSAKGPEELDHAWKRVVKHFSVLVDSAENGDLRRAILDLAARGRLTNRPKDVAMDVRTDGPFAIPAHWQWMPGREVFSFVTSGSRGWAQFYPADGPLFLRIGNLDYERVGLDLRTIQHVRPPKNAEGTRTRVQPGDVLISITGDTGMVGLVPEGIGEAYINQHIALGRPSPVVLPEYVSRVLTAPSLLGRLQGAQRGIKNSLGLDDVRDLLIPAPPRDEQGQLVARLGEMLNVCDELERRFGDAQGRGAKLVDAVVQELAAGWMPA